MLSPKRFVNVDESYENGGKHVYNNNNKNPKIIITICKMNQSFVDKGSFDDILPQLEASTTVN